MATATSLTLRALLSQATARVALDHLAPVTAGLTPAAKALAAVAATRGASGLVVLVVPTDKDVEQLVGDARFFYSALEGASDADVERAVLPLPSLQVDPYRGMSPHFRVAAARASSGLSPPRGQQQHAGALQRNLKSQPTPSPRAATARQEHATSDRIRNYSVAEASRARGSAE